MALEEGFLFVIRRNFEKLNDINVVSKLWREILDGKRFTIPTDLFIEYSYHCPVDTEFYLEGLNAEFDNSSKEDLRTIDNDLKAYLLTLLYYSMDLCGRISFKTSLHAAKLYMKIILLPSGLGELYYEKHIYETVTLLITKNLSRCNSCDGCVLDVLKFIRDHSVKQSLELKHLKGFTNLLSAMVMYTAKDHGSNFMEAHTLAGYSLKCLKELVEQNTQPMTLTVVMESLLIFVTNIALLENLSEEQRKVGTTVFKRFITEVLNKQFDEDKMQYFVEALFAVWGKKEFCSYHESTEILNSLEKVYYCEVLRRIPNYLVSKNYKKRSLVLLNLIYEMTINLRSPFDEKCETLYFCCVKNMLMLILSKNKAMQDKAIETLSKIFSMEQNSVVNKMFELYEATGKMVTLSLDTILNAFCVILDEKYGSACSNAKNKHILVVASKIMIHTNAVNGDLGANFIYLMCKDSTPFTLKPMLPILHEIFLCMAFKKEEKICHEILKIFLKNALHQDSSSRVFLEHLYQSLINISVANGKTFPPKYYTNLFLTEDYEYRIFFTKCTNMIRYEHVQKTIAEFDYVEHGYAILLRSLLEYVKYKEIDILLEYIIDNFAGLCITENAGVLFDAFSIIITNNDVIPQYIIPKLDVLYGYLWEAIFNQSFVVSNIKNAYELILLLRNTLNLIPDENMELELIDECSRNAYTALQITENSSSILYLAELCIVLRKMPNSQVQERLELLIGQPNCLNILKTQYPEYLIQILSYFTNFAILKKTCVPKTLEALRSCLNCNCEIIKIAAIKLLYSLCTNITHEMEDIIAFVLKEISAKNPCLSRICLVIMEELIHDDYLMLNSEEFFKFVYRLGSKDLCVFAQSTLEKRFMLANKNDIGRYYTSTVVFTSGYTKFNNYSIPESFRYESKKIRENIDCPTDIFSYLFKAVPIKTKFNILREMAFAFEEFMLGHFRVSDEYFNLMTYFLYTFKLMSPKYFMQPSKEFYNKVCKDIEKQVLSRDPKFREASFYGEYETDIKKCTITLLKLLFFIEDDERLMDKFKYNLFNTIMYWTDHVKPEIIHLIYYEKNEEVMPYLLKLTKYYKKNKDAIENLLSNQER